MICLAKKNCEQLFHKFNQQEYYENQISHILKKVSKPANVFINLKYF